MRRLEGSPLTFCRAIQVSTRRVCFEENDAQDAITNTLLYDTSDCMPIVSVVIVDAEIMSRHSRYAAMLVAYDDDDASIFEDWAATLQNSSKSPLAMKFWRALSNAGEVDSFDLSFDSFPAEAKMVFIPTKNSVMTI
mmetsp:Transcript_26043/g.39266  ORF Transcript_26043/g.39266 Transcript_26043/m.39266 type:complete len:137 (+) Transcript_26043:138-548(+)